MDAVQDLYEFSGGVMTQVSVGDVYGNGAAAAAFMDMSSDGKLVFFRTQEQLTSGDTDSCGGVAPVGCADVYVRDLGAVPQTRLISTGPNEPDADYNAFFGGITPDGARVLLQHERQSGRRRHRLTTMRTSTSATATPRRRSRSVP